MIPSPDSVTYSISPPSIISVSDRQPSSCGNSDDVTNTPELAGHASPAEGVGLLAGVAGAGVSLSVVEPSHPQSTPKVVDVA